MSKIPPKIFKIFNYKKKVIKFKKFKNQNINKNYLKWINDKDLMKHSRHGQNKQDKSTVSKYVKSMKNNWFLIICVKKNKYFKHIGNISVRFYKEDESASISILIGSSKFRNKLGTFNNPYYKKDTAQNIINRLANFKPSVKGKIFVDL